VAEIVALFGISRQTIYCALKDRLPISDRDETELGVQMAAVLKADQQPPT
jgi:hypothetical protein